jgi:hypothetical protein
LYGAAALWLAANFAPDVLRIPNEAPAPAAFLKNARLFIIIPLLIEGHQSFQFVPDYVAGFHSYSRLSALALAKPSQLPTTSIGRELARHHQGKPGAIFL